MSWFVLSILVAFFQALENVFTKKSLKNADEYLIAWAFSFFCFVFLSPFLFFIDFPVLDGDFYLALLVSGSLNIFTTILVIKAIKFSDISIVAPIGAFTPLFLLISSPFIVGEFPRTLGLVGVLLIVLGVYVLNIKIAQRNYWDPFKNFFKEKGAMIMMIVAFIWSISSNFDKIGVQASSATFWAIAINLFLVVALFPIMLYKSKNITKGILINYKQLLPVGFFSALATILQMMAINLTLVSYVIAIKRSSAIISVLLGHFVFKEKGFRERLVGVVIMIIGALLIGLS